MSAHSKTYNLVKALVILIVAVLIIIAFLLGIRDTPSLEGTEIVNWLLKVFPK